MRRKYPERGRLAPLVPAVCVLACLLQCAQPLAEEAAPGRPAGAAREGTLVYRDPRLEPRPPARRWSIFLPSIPRESYGPLRDPRFNQTHPFRLQVLCTTDESEEGGVVTRAGRSGHGRRFVVHYVRPSDEALARKIAGVLARLYWIAWDYLGRRPSETAYTNVWLSAHGQAGGEEFNGHIYIYGIDEARAPAEWVRELAHEYAHLTIPEAGPFSAPEKWANGYLGERLFLKWLLHDNAQHDVWGGRIDGHAYVSNQLAPLRDLFLNEGPRDTHRVTLGAPEMQRFIGQVLAVEASYGVRVLKSLLARFVAPHPQNLGVYLSSALEDLKEDELRIDPAIYIPRRSRPVAGGGRGDANRFEKAGYWVFLGGGEWRIEAIGRLPASTLAALEHAEIARLPRMVGSTAEETAAWKATVSLPNGMWRRLELTAPTGKSMELRALILRRHERL